MRAWLIPDTALAIDMPPWSDVMAVVKGDIPETADR